MCVGEGAWGRQGSGFHRLPKCIRVHNGKCEATAIHAASFLLLPYGTSGPRLSIPQSHTSHSVTLSILLSIPAGCVRVWRFVLLPFLSPHQLNKTNSTPRNPPLAVPRRRWILSLAKPFDKLLPRVPPAHQQLQSLAGCLALLPSERSRGEACSQKLPAAVHHRA